MKVESKASGACRVRLSVRTEASETRPEYDRILADYTRHGRLPGFRPGKAPRALVESRYRQEIGADVRSNLIRKFYQKAVKEAGLSPVAVVDVTDVLFAPETGIEFVVMLDVAPEFPLPKYKQIPLQGKPPSVPEEQVTAQLERFRDMMARFEESADEPAARNDFVQVDFTASCDGRPLAEAVPEAAAVASGTDFLLQVSEPGSIPGLGLGLEGVRKGEEKSVPVTFGPEFHLEAVRGKSAVYQVRVKAVRRRVQPADDVICERLGCETLDGVRERIRKNLLAGAEQEELARQRQEVADYLLKRTEFDLPESVLAEETNNTVRAMMHEMIERGGKREDLAKNRAAILENATTASKDRVRLRYILARIADEEKVSVSPEEVNARLELLAAQYRMPVQKVRETIEARHGVEALASDIRSDKTMALLLEQAKA
jgi:trigger factor